MNEAVALLRRIPGIRLSDPRATTEGTIEITGDVGVFGGSGLPSCNTWSERPESERITLVFADGAAGTTVLAEIRVALAYTRNLPTLSSIIGAAAQRYGRPYWTEHNLNYPHASRFPPDGPVEQWIYFYPDVRSDDGVIIQLCMAKDDAFQPMLDSRVHLFGIRIYDRAVLDAAKARFMAPPAPRPPPPPEPPRVRF